MPPIRSVDVSWWSGRVRSRTVIYELSRSGNAASRQPGPYPSRPALRTRCRRVDSFTYEERFGLMMTEQVNKLRHIRADPVGR